MAPKADLKVTNTRIKEPLVDGFLHALSAVRAAAENTLVAYRRDLDDCCVGLAQDGQSLSTCSPEDLRALLVWWHQRGLAPRSVRAP